MWPPSWALKWSCLPLSPVVSLHVGWVLVGVVGFLGSEVVLSPVVSGCLPSCGGWVLVGVVGFLGSEVVLSPVVSHCLSLSPVVSLHVGGGCWLVWLASWALKWSCLPLSPVVSGCLPSCGGWVLVGVAAILGSEMVLSPVVFVMWGGCWLVWSASWALKWSCLPLSPNAGCLPSCGGGCWLVWSASWALKWSCLPLSPVVSLHVGVGCWLVWSASWALKWSCLPLSPIVSGCLPSCGKAGVGWCGRLLGL